MNECNNLYLCTDKKGDVCKQCFNWNHLQNRHRLVDMVDKMAEISILDTCFMSHTDTDRQTEKITYTVYVLVRFYHWFLIHLIIIIRYCDGFGSVFLIFVS